MAPHSHKPQIPAFAVRREGHYADDLPTTPNPTLGRILVTGATGYIGGRLVPELRQRGYNVRVMVRRELANMKERWPGVEIFEADALDGDSMAPALQGVHTAYYLIHSMLLGPRRFSDADLRAAVNFRTAAEQAGVQRIIYLGGLGDLTFELSRHLRSRMEVAQLLAAGSVPTTILRAAIIIGAGSASYEIVHGLVARIPTIIGPQWFECRCQPIGIRDVIKYLVGCLECPPTTGQSYDIGGPDVLSYRQMIEIFAQQLGLKRIVRTGPNLPLGLYSYALSMITPVPEPIIHCLLESIRNEVVCHDSRIRETLPFAPLSYSDAILAALNTEQQDLVATRWSNAYPPTHQSAPRLSELNAAPRFRAHFALPTSTPPQLLFAELCRVGGESGWPKMNWLWRLRGWLDRLLLGVGSVRGRRSQTTLVEGDVIDFWRVEHLNANRMLLLRAEMKLPGKAWLEFRITPTDAPTTPAGLGTHDVSATAWFEPSGVMGDLYWYACLPFHYWIFVLLLKQIDRRARTISTTS